MAEEKLSTTKDINHALKEYLKKHRAVTIGGHDSPLAGQHSIAVGLSAGKVTVEGEAGDFFGTGKLVHQGNFLMEHRVRLVNEPISYA